MTNADTIDRVSEKLKQLKQINEERPCSECKWHHYKSGYMTCGAATGSCNFNHSKFERAPKSTTKHRSKSHISKSETD